MASMGTSSFFDHVQTVVVVEGGDLTICYEQFKVLNADGDGAGKLKLVETTNFIVSKDKTVAIVKAFHSRTDPTSAWFRAGEQVINITNASDDKLDRYFGPTKTALKVFFYILNNNPLADQNDFLKSVSIKDIYHIISCCPYWDLKAKEYFKAWFSNWYKCNNNPLWKIEDHSTFLFPCFMLDHAEAFAASSVRLAYYQAYHIHEINPTELHHLHLDPIIIQQINAARVNLRNRLNQDLASPTIPIYESARCSCKEKTVFDYHKHLIKLEAWPMAEVYGKSSVHSLLKRLEAFAYEPPKDACTSCRNPSYPKGNHLPRYCRSRSSLSWTPLTHIVQSDLRRHFQGLCLDCMDKSRSTTGGPCSEYWEQGQFGLEDDEWDTKCRVQHGQASWYYSFLSRGRFDERKKWLEWKTRNDPGFRINRECEGLF